MGVRIVILGVIIIVIAAAVIFVRAKCWEGLMKFADKLVELPSDDEQKSNKT